MSFFNHLNECLGNTNLPDGMDVATFLDRYLTEQGFSIEVSEETLYNETEDTEEEIVRVKNHSNDRSVSFEYNTGFIHGVIGNRRRRGLVLDHIHQAICILTGNADFSPFSEYSEQEKIVLLEILQLQWASETIVGAKYIHNWNITITSSPIFKKDLPYNWQWAYPETTGYSIKFLCNNAVPEIVLNGVRYNGIRWGWAARTIDFNLTFAQFMSTQPTEPTARDEAPCSIMNYSTRVESVIPVNITPGQTLYGIELELDKVNETKLKKAHDYLKKHCIFKRDGSVSDGVEIVSKPDTIENHKEVFKKFIVDGKSADLIANSNCGIHIHVSRGHMSFLTLGRINAFMNINKEKVEKIAGRSSSYAKFSQNSNEQGLLNPWYQANGDKYSKTKKFSWDKYTCLNLAPQHTMEFRIFKSTTDWEEFCRFLEFTEALVNYCCLAGNDNKGKISNMKSLMAFENFAAFVASRGSSFSSLNKFIKKEFA